MKADNENSTWTTLGLAATRVLENCEQKQEQRERDAQRERDEEEKAEQHRRAVDEGLRHITAFEERAAGHVRRKRN